MHAADGRSLGFPCSDRSGHEPVVFGSAFVVVRAAHGRRTRSKSDESCLCGPRAARALARLSKAGYLKSGSDFSGRRCVCGAGGFRFHGLEEVVVRRGRSRCLGGPRCCQDAGEFGVPSIKNGAPLPPDVQYELGSKSANGTLEECSHEQEEPLRTEEIKTRRSKVPCFVVWGPPGAGKSTLCERLSRAHGLVHVSSGALLEAHVLYNTPLGEKAKPYIESGMSVPDELVLQVVLARVLQNDCMSNGFLCDGFPLTAEQDDALREAGFVYKQAFVLFAPRAALTKRLRHRRIDPETQHVYNLKYMPPQSREVLERLIIRDGDNEEGIENTLSEYSSTRTMFFDGVSTGIISINADRDHNAVFEEVSSSISMLGSEALDDDLSGSSLDSVSSGSSSAIGAVYGDVDSSFDTDSDSGDDSSVGAAAGVAERGVDSVSGSRAAEVQTKSVTGAPARKKVATGKVPITLIRCDGYVCERESVDQSNITFRGAATEQVMLVWNERPRSVLLLSKKDPELFPHVLQASQYMSEVQGLRVVVEPFIQTEAIANGTYLESFTSAERLYSEIDLVVCLGGDGLIMHVSTLFRTACPPVISFNLGSLGFLTPFDFEEFETEIESVLEGNCLMSLRMRLSGKVLSESRPSREFLVLNELVVDRGSSPYLSNLDCFCDDKFITTVQADGIIMSTPTGSTAYSMSAGGSMVHPSVPAILFTPICPHSLSFRPIVFPDSAKLRVDVSPDSRAHAWVSFDGKFRQQLKRGDGLLVQMSLFPVPTVNKTDHTGDWFGSLSRAFNFNTRGATQKRLRKKWKP